MEWAISTQTQDKLRPGKGLRKVLRDYHERLKVHRSRKTRPRIRRENRDRWCKKRLKHKQTSKSEELKCRASRHLRTKLKELATLRVELWAIPECYMLLSTQVASRPCHLKNSKLCLIFYHQLWRLQWPTLSDRAFQTPPSRTRYPPPRRTWCQAVTTPQKSHPSRR